MTVFLVVLGLAWNGGLVGGSAMLAASVPAAVRPYAEGVGEVAMGAAAAVGAPVAGVVVAGGGFAALCLAGAAVGGLAAVAVHLGRRQVLAATGSPPR
jgi:predicted MFS family arabinose efflux permease